MFYDEINPSTFMQKIVTYDPDEEKRPDKGCPHTILPPFWGRLGGCEMCEKNHLNVHDK